MKLTEKEMVCIIRSSRRYRLINILNAEAQKQVSDFAEKSLELQWGEAGQIIVSPACLSRLKHVYG